MPASRSISARRARRPGVDPERRSYSTFVTLHDPDGNTWLVQEVKRDWVLKQVKRDEVAA